MKASELIKKLQVIQDKFGDMEVVCDLHSTNKWYSEHQNTKSIYGTLCVQGYKILILV